jgi:hypothetical protein
MYPEIKNLFEQYDDHVFIVSVKIDDLNAYDSLDSLKNIMFLDIIKDSLPTDQIKYILNDDFSYEVAKQIVLENLQFFKLHEFLILALKINKIPETTENS